MLSTTPLIEIHDSLDVPVTPALIPTAAVPASLPSTVIPKAIKFLLPHAQAGAIIGKSGSGIHAIQSCDGIWLKLGGPADYFPGTNERVLFLAGSNAGFVAAVDMILRRLHAVRSHFHMIILVEILVACVLFRLLCLNCVSVSTSCLVGLAAVSWGARFNFCRMQAANPRCFLLKWLT